MRRDDDADRTIHARKLFDNDGIFDVTQPRAPVLLREDRAHVTERAELLDYVERKSLGLIPLHHVGRDLSRRKLAHFAAQLFLLGSVIKVHVSIMATSRPRVAGDYVAGTPVWFGQLSIVVCKGRCWNPSDKNLQRINGRTVMSGRYLVKSVVLWVSRQGMLYRRIVATMLASWICFPWIVRDFNRSSRTAVTAASSSAISNSASNWRTARASESSVGGGTTAPGRVVEARNSRRT